MKKIVLKRALEIAAKTMTAAGLCTRKNSGAGCGCGPTLQTCDECIQEWLISRAVRELDEEGRL